MTGHSALAPTRDETLPARRVAQAGRTDLAGGGIRLAAVMTGIADAHQAPRADRAQRSSAFEAGAAGQSSPGGEQVIDGAADAAREQRHRHLTIPCLAIDLAFLRTKAFSR